MRGKDQTSNQNKKKFLSRFSEPVRSFSISAERGTSVVVLAIAVVTGSFNLFSDSLEEFR
jgi:hypothetical protein